MGIYVYSIKRSSRRTVEFDGKKVEAAALTYQYKPMTGFRLSRYDVPHEAAMARIDKAWGGQTPDLIVVGEWQEGATVQGAWPKGRIAWTDCYDLPGHTVGHLARKGRGWRVVPVTG